MDGELWMGRGSFERLNGLLKSKSKNSEKIEHEKWKEVKYMIFDLPNSKENVENRIEMMKMIPIPEFAKIVEKIKCEGNEHLELHLNQIVIGGA